MADRDGVVPPKVLTTHERDEALLTHRNGAPQTAETKQLMEGMSLFRPGDYYQKNRSNLANRAVANGFRAHVKKAVVDGENGYVVWWDRVR